MDQSSYRKLGLGTREELSRCTTIRQRQGQHRWVITKYDNGVHVWLLDDKAHDFRRFIVRWGLDFFVGNVPITNFDSVALHVTAGPFKELRVAKVAYLMEG